MPQQVLLIDDSQAIHALVRARLADEPLTVLSAFSGEEGLKAAQSAMPDLILLDMDLPDLDSLEVCKRLKVAAPTSSIPIVFLVGSATTENKTLGLELGAADFVAKPFHPAELRARVRAALRTKHLMDLLEKKARVDGLTGLWNRMFFENRLGQETSLARRANRSLSSIRVDVEQFKRINNDYGYPFGDGVLQRIAAALSESTRMEDVVCRIGGAEFAILCPNTSAADATFLVSRCRQKIAAIRLQCRNKTIGISCSFRITEEHASGSLPLQAAMNLGT
jgi:two-component system, cell cycle response regulator